MRGLTKFLTYNGELVKKIFQPVDLELNSIVEIENAPNGKPILTPYRIEKKEVKITLSGVFYLYTVNKTGNDIEQEFFIH